MAGAGRSGNELSTEHAEAACHNLVVSRILLVLFVHAAIFAQEMSMKVEIDGIRPCGAISRRPSRRIPNPRSSR